MIDPKKTKKKRDNLINFLKKRNIITSIHYIPIHGDPYFRKYNFKPTQFSNSNFYNKNAISLPIYPDFNKNQQDFVIQSIKKFFNKS